MDLRARGATAVTSLPLLLVVALTRHHMDESLPSGRALRLPTLLSSPRPGSPRDVLSLCVSLTTLRAIARAALCAP
eukprot:scaffold91177_cov35-Tisochrysis_lutea.AAC.1